MVTIKTVRELALSFPETDEHPHFYRTAFRVRKKIFATVSEKDKILMAKLTPVDQSVFAAIDKNVIYPVPGGWGLKGATFVNLKKVKKTILTDILTVAWCTAAPAKLAAPFIK
jgi:hypothetical protein